MNGKTWTANPLLLGLLLLALGVPCAFASAAEEPQAAAAGEKEVPNMSPEATMLGDLKHLEPHGESTRRSGHSPLRSGSLRAPAHLARCEKPDQFPLDGVWRPSRRRRRLRQWRPGQIRSVGR